MGRKRAMVPDRKRENADVLKTLNCKIDPLHACMAAEDRWSDPCTSKTGA